MSEDLYERLAGMSRRLKKGKSWIINQALEEYLRDRNRQVPAEEARRQSLLASATATEDEKHWANLTDTRGWR